MSELYNLHHRIIRRPDVERITGLARSTIYDFMSRGEFPQPLKLGARAVGWRESDVLEWIAAREPRKVAA
jgi:prophage regulatory protein